MANTVKVLAEHYKTAIQLHVANSKWVDYFDDERLSKLFSTLLTPASVGERAPIMVGGIPYSMEDYKVPEFLKKFVLPAKVKVELNELATNLADYSDLGVDECFTPTEFDEFVTKMKTVFRMELGESRSLKDLSEPVLLSSVMNRADVSGFVHFDGDEANVFMPINIPVVGKMYDGFYFTVPVDRMVSLLCKTSLDK